MNNQNELKVYTSAELIQKVKTERLKRLKRGITMQEFRVHFQKKDLTIQIERDGQDWYEIDLERCTNSNELLDWILHIHGKTWAMSNSMIAVILTTLDDACHSVFGEGTEALFRNKKSINWKNPN
jgi:hypothetical protein